MIADRAVASVAPDLLCSFQSHGPSLRKHGLSIWVGEDSRGCEESNVVSQRWTQSAN
jgi:hypothetical protein